MNKFVIKSLSALIIISCLSVAYTPITANTSTFFPYDKLKACEIFNLTATPQPCTPNGVFFVEIDFEVAGDPSGGFTVQGNGNDYGVFEYGDLPIQVGPLEGDGITIWEFVVTDLEDDNCTEFTVIDPVTCDVQGACEITALVVDPLDCNDDGTYDIVINFEYSNPGNDFFDLFDENGNLLAFYELAALPVTHPGFIPSGNDFDVITVCINDNPDCCATEEFLAPDCTPPPCEISNVTATPGDCDGLIFWVTINFEYNNTGDFFTVAGNGNDYGTFEYGNLPIVVGPLAGDGTTIWEFVVTDQADPECTDFTVIDPVDCGMNNCEIWDLVVDPLECNDDGTYDILINFNYVNPGNDFFDVFDADGNNLGFYALADLPVTHLNFVPSGNDFDFLSVCINDTPDCCAETEFEALDCNPPACEIWDLVAEAHACDDNGQFLVDLDFNFANTSDSFTVVGDGNNYGTFAYADLFITLGPFEGNGQLMEFIVFDQNDDGCNAEVGLEAPNCAQGNCELWDLVVDPLECNDDGTYDILINFNYVNPGNDFFDVFDADGNNLGFYALADLPVTHLNFVPSGNDFDFLSVCINDTPDCCAETEFEALDCNPPACEIWDLVAEAHACDDNGQFLVDIDFNFANTSDSFTVVGDGNNYGTFAYADLFITLGPFEGNGQLMEFIVFDQNDDGCNAEVGLEAPNCNNNACEIGMVNFEPGCDGDISYGFINFDYANTSDSFNLTINNEDYTFAYSDLPVNLSPLPDNGNTYMLVTVTDQMNPNCINEVDHEAIICTNNACEIWDLIAEAHTCDDNGQFLVNLDFNFDNTSDSFIVVGNGNNYGTFAYADLFITLGPFDGNGQAMEFIVFDQDQESCNAEVVIEAPHCGAGDCHIFELVTEAHTCDDNGQFLVDLDFNFDNTSDSFIVVGNGNNYGTFAYADLFITLGPFEGNGQLMEFIVFDQNDDGCNAEVGLEAPNCAQGNCELWDLVVDPLECNDDGTYDILINFNYVNPGNDFFDVFDADGNNLGFYALADLPVTHLNFVPSGNDFDFLSVCINDTPDCCAEAEFEALDCNPPACEIWDLVAEAHTCDDNGQFLVDLDFNFDNTSDSFIVVGNGNNYGTFAYADLFITLGPFDGNGQAMEFIVFDQDQESCHAEVVIEAPHCGAGDCHIFELVAEAHACDDNGQFLVDLDFNFDNTSDSFIVVGNGNNYGTFAYADLFITLGPFEGNGQAMEFIVFDQDQESCHAEVVIEAPHCGAGDCHIFELVAEAHACDDNGQFLVDLDFNFDNTSDSFIVVGNGNNYGTFAYADLFITLGPFDGNGQAMEFIVFDQDQESCHAEVLIEAPHCGAGDCHIFELVAEAHACDDNGQFLVDLDFNFDNTSDSFIVVGNGNNYGTFAYADLFITLGPFQGNGQAMEFIVFDQDQESCHAEVVIEAPHCGAGDCHITELVADPIECNDDGTYSLAINFQYENPGNDFFDVYGTNGEFIGFFNLNDLPIVIDNFNPSGNAFDVVTVCINDNPDCCATTEFEALDCEEACQIEGLEAEAFCDGDDLYVEFTFNYSGVGDSFNLLSCTGLGTFAYGQDSYVIQIPDDLVDCAGGIIIPLGVFDQEDQFCGDAVLVAIPDCYDTGCIIGEIETEISDCENGQFFVTLNFDYQDVSDEGFQVFGNGNNYGAFEYTALPITLGPFDASGQAMEFIVMDIVDEECWNFTELEAPVCFAEAEYCIEFESLYNGVNYGGSNSNPGDLLLIEDGVYVTMEGVVDPLGNNNYDYLFATNQDVCSPFEAANGIRMFMFNGLRFDFSQLPENPGVVIFNYHNCGIPFAVSANDVTPITYVFPEVDQSFNLVTGVEIHFDVDEDNPERGTATLEGDIASLFVGGVELQVDNVCFNVEQELTDVWPGDADYNNTATHFDLLNIGLAYGFEGTERDNINIDWFAMPAEDWDGEFLNETNHKHADTNGDGLVNAEDAGAILENYGLEHGEVPIFIPVEGTANDPALFVDLPDAQDIIIGQPFEAPIILGTPAIPVEDIYGLAFTVEFDVDMMDENEVAIVLNDSWMGENGQNLITLNKSMAQEGRFDIAITRTNHENVSGQGAIGNFIGIIDDILGKQETEVTISGVKSINNLEMPVPLNTPTEVVDLATSIDIRLIENDLEVFPNPTDEILFILNSGTEPMRRIQLYNTLGQLMTEIQNPEPLQQIDVSRWAAGMYFVTIEIGDAVITKKVKVTNL